MLRAMLFLSGCLWAGEDWLQLHERGKELAQRGDFAGAETVFSSALAQANSNRTRGLTLCSLAYVCHEQGDDLRAHKLLSEATGALDQMSSADAANVVACKHNFATVKRRLGRFDESFSLYQETLALAEKYLGLKHPITARTFHKLAMVEMDLGRLEDAEAHLKRSMELNESCCGPVNAELVASLSLLGEIYRIRGDAIRAESTLRRALHDAEKIDPQSDKVAAVLDYLARLQYDAGALQKAERNWRRSLAIFEALKSTNTSAGIVLARRGELQRVKKRYRESEQLLKRAVSVLEESRNQAYLTSALSVLAAVYLDQGNIHEAEVLYRRILSLAERELGPNHPQVGVILNGLSRTLVARKAYKDAETSHRRAIEILESYYGPGHRHLLPYLTDYAHLLRKLRRSHEAAAVETRIRQIHASGGPAMKLNTVDVRELSVRAEAARRGNKEKRNSAGLAAPRESVVREFLESGGAAPGVNVWEQSIRAAREVADKGEFDRARQLLMAELAKLETPHPDRSRLIITLNELALVSSSLGQFSQAERNYRRAIQLAEQPPKAGGLVFAKLLDGLASVYLNVGHYAEAERLHVRALERLPSDFGPNHPERAQMLSNLGTVYIARGKRQQAQQVYQQALTMFENAYGPDDERTCRVVQNIAVVAAKMGRNSEAAAYLSRAVSCLEARLGSSHPLLVHPLVNQARVHLRLKRPTEAEDFARRGLGIAESAYGPVHPLVAEALLIYGETLRANKRKEMAKDMERRALATRQTIRADRAAESATVHISDLTGKP